MLKALIPALMLAGTSFAAEFPRGPGLGHAASPEAVAAWDTDVMPDGRGLPAGKGTAKQGKAIYETQCQSCHGQDGLGDSGDQLAGAKMGLTDEYPEKTIGNFWPHAPTLFDLIRRSMPMQSPGSLSNDEVYAVTAYLLYLNGLVEQDEVIDARALAGIRMPNRNGFIDAWQLEGACRLAHGCACAAEAMDGRERPRHCE